ncbi:hypothetical protein ACH8I4_17920, partial [Acinetobacter sp. ABJ_C3_5]|uniref:hypothetical protein n=1 Tax=Acinetobacter courvalinii TaxID=280147 RepID=UPI0037C85327
FILDFEGLGHPVNSFEDVVVDFKENHEELKRLSFKSTQLFHELVFESRYFELYGGKLDLISLKAKYKLHIQSIGYVMGEIQKANIQEFIGLHDDFISSYNDFEAVLSELLNETYKMLLK